MKLLKIFDKGDCILDNEDETSPDIYVIWHTLF